MIRIPLNGGIFLFRKNRVFKFYKGIYLFDEIKQLFPLLVTKY